MLNSFETAAGSRIKNKKQAPAINAGLKRFKSQTKTNEEIEVSKGSSSPIDSSDNTRRLHTNLTAAEDNNALSSIEGIQKQQSGEVVSKLLPIDSGLKELSIVESDNSAHGGFETPGQGLTNKRH